MKQFATVSPSHLTGDERRAAWQRFRDGGYVAIGFLRGRLDQDLTGMTIEEVEALIRGHGDEDGNLLPRIAGVDTVRDALRAFRGFWRVRKADYVAVPNGSHGLLGIGVVTSGYSGRETVPQQREPTAP